MAPKLVLLVSLGGSMGFKRTIMKWTLNARVTGLHPQISMKKATTLDCSITQLDSWRSSHLAGQVKTKTCRDPASHFWGCAAVVGILQRSENGGAGPHSWVTEITSEKAHASVPGAPFISLEKSLLLGGMHMYSRLPELALQPFFPEGLIPYGWCCWEAGSRFPMFFFYPSLPFLSPCPHSILGTKACIFSLASPWYSVSTTDHSTPILLLPPSPNPINSLNC